MVGCSIQRSMSVSSPRWSSRFSIQQPTITPMEWAGRPVLAYKGSKAFSKKRPIDRISEPLDLVFWMENGIEFRVQSLGLFWSYFLDHFDKVLRPRDAFPCRFQNLVFANRAPFNPTYQGNDGLYLSF